MRRSARPRRSPGPERAPEPDRAMYPGAHARLDPERVAVVMTGSGAALTYAELEDRSAPLANRLREGGFQRGDVIALVSRNDARIFEVYWAAQRAGLYITVID